MAEAWGSPIVVGFDGSPDSVRALDWALAQAGLRGAPVTLCHTWHRPHSAVDTGSDAVDGPEATAQLVLDEGSRHAAKQAPAVHLRAELLSGLPAELLAQVARTAALFVVGARGAGGAHDSMLGSVSARLARHGACPLVVVRDVAVDGGGGGGQDRRIVVGVDTSADVETAVAFAFEHAARLGGSVHAVHAYDEAAVQTVAYLDEAELHRLRQNAHDDFGALLAPQADKYPGIAVSFQLVHGGPAPALVEASAEADLLVLGSHGHGRLATAVLGSTSHTVLHHAACPVAIVHGER
jgi:nucleotide-binding universal stress UspA family protein